MADDSRELLAKAVTEIRRLKAENAALKGTAKRAEPVAIVGIACRFPGDCNDPESYWRYLSEGRSAVRPTPEDRADGMTGTFGSFLDDKEGFDAAFFGISPREAQSLDPQQRLLLEVAWHAFESANIRPDTIVGRDVGVFVGMSGIDYALRLFAPGNRDRIDPYFGTGTTLSPAAGRLSYFLKVNGPSLVVDTACSSALVAIHLAAESLRRGECEMALAAAANRILGPDLTLNFARSGLLSSDGRCCAFDESAQGYARGEGGGALLLKRLSDAEAAGDVIHGLILGSAINQDGGSGGLTVPNGTAQQKVIRKALEMAGLTPADVDYVEAHGTGTKLGDPIEVNALATVFGPGREDARPLCVGSVKTNFGHLEAAAGMASAIKVLQALRHEAIPPHLNFRTPSSHIDWAGGRIKVVDTLRPWARGDRPRVAGVSGFGFAGTNVHVVFGEASPTKPRQGADTASGPELLVLSAKGPDALRAQAIGMADRLDHLPPSLWADAAHTSRVGRVGFVERAALVASTPGEAAAVLRAFADKGRSRGLASGRAADAPRTAFVFTGQGAQYAGMGRRLYETQPVFRDIVDECAGKLQAALGRDVRDVIFSPASNPVRGSGGKAAEGPTSVLESTRNTDVLTEIDRTVFTQTGLFVLEYALARLWQSWGVQPEVVLGHSVGEYAAACVAGVFELDDALRLIVARGRLMEERSAAGAMLTVFADESVVVEHLKPFAEMVSIAAVNGPEIVLVSGAKAAIDALQGALDKAQIRVVRMRISHAFHSPLTEPVLADIEALAGSMQLRRPSIRLISNVTGGFVDEEVTRPEYWARHLRQSVRFCESMTLLHEQLLDYFVEIGPDPTLLGLDLCFRVVREKVSSKAKWVSSLRRGQDDVRSMLESAGRLWVAGAPVNWAAVESGRELSCLPLPLYPYQRKRHWIDVAESAPTTTCAAPAITTAVTEPDSPALLPPSQPETAVSGRLTPDEVLAEVQAIISEVSGLEPADLPRTANLLEMGLDSLMFVRAGRTIEKRFEVRIAIKQFYEDLHRIGPLVDFLLANGKTAREATRSTAEVTSPAGGATDRSVAAENAATRQSGAAQLSVSAVPGIVAGEMDPVMRAHFELMERYLAAKSGSGASSHTGSNQPRLSAPVDSRMTSGFAGLKLDAEKLSPQQEEFIRKLTQRYVARTAKSKAQTQAWRRDLADWKASLQFKRSLKEIKYPIVAERASGARLWDVDGNEYIDLALGMGVHFLGHGPEFINAALHRQIDRSAALGPQSDLAGEVARKICQLTGAERATLAITGTGAVMLAQRLARAATGRSLIAQFAGAYHGFNSEVLVAVGEDGPRPLSPGVPRSIVENARVLDYGSEEALEWIRENAGQLAAVMVEPVQSRRPGFQPQRFLRRLRRLTEELDIALIFDEMINGFRIHAGGAQAWFGIQADLVTYGKIVGGGMPLSAVAGKAKYLDWIDGGFWQFGDDSAPSPQTIFTGGTHNRHPLALAAANAALDHLIAEGPALHDRVNRLTERLGKELNGFFESESVALRASWFGSQFRLESLGDPFEMEVLFYLLTERGFYTWEQRICCLSTQHTDADVDHLVASVREAVAEMRAGGFTIQAGANAPRRILPMSSVQERLYALCQREGAEMPYHLSGVWEIRGPVDAFKVRDSFHEIIRRHESLRTAFGLIAGKPCQFVVDEPRFDLEEPSLSGRSPEALLSDFIRPFDLERPPLLRVGLARVDATRSLLLIDVHHIAADGLSMNVILGEFASLYDGVRLRPVKRQYRHALEEVSSRRALPEYRAQENYWLAEMAGEIPVLDLPTDFPRSGEMDFRGDKCLLRIEPERTAKLEAFARERGGSLYMVLMAGFATLLHRLTGASDVIVGLPVAGRPGADNDDVVGMFVNSLPLRFRPERDLSFVDFLSAVRATCLGAYDHSDYAFGELVARLDVPRNPDRNPLFDVMFAYESADGRAMRTQDLEIRTIDQYEGSGMFDLSVDIIREAGTLNVRFHYATRLFRRETIERWCDAYSVLLDSVLSAPCSALGRLAMISLPERKRIAVDFNAASGEISPPTSLVELWTASVKAHAGLVAIVSRECRLTFEEADRRANAIASRLIREHGIKPGDRIALLLDGSERQILAILGVLKAGAAYVPIDPANPSDRVRMILEDSGVRAVLVEEGTEPQGYLTGNANEVAVLEIGRLSLPLKGRARPNLPEVNPTDAAYVIYTSGSTGRPKGVLIEHRGISNSVLWRMSAYQFTERDVTLTMPSYAFDASLLDIFPVLFAGGRVVVASTEEKRDLAGQADRLTREGVTNLLLTPSLHSLYLREIASAMTELRFVCVAGETTPLSLLRAHFEKLPAVRLYNEYGPTENSVVTTFTELYATDVVVTIGRPVAGNRVFIVEPGGEVCGVGIPGELFVSGPGLARGYVNRQDLTDAAFTAAPWDPALRVYRTGDVARWREDGMLDFLGRRDGQVKLRGYRIELEEIEEVLRKQPGVAEAAAIIAPVSGDPQLIGYVCPVAGYDEAQVRAALQQLLPAYMVPSLYVTLPALPLNQNGKVNRRALPVPSAQPTMSASESPHGDRELLLAEVWSEVLRRDSLGRNDDYFRLGGDSIKGIQIISRLLQRGWRLDMRWLFRCPTIAQLAPYLEQTASNASVRVGSAGDAIELMPIQRWFLDTCRAHPNHFNQAVWLEAPERWNVDALQTALRHVTDAHEAFRARFDASTGEARLAGTVAFSCRVLDLRSAEAEHRLDEVVAEEQASLDVARGPLSRAVIVRRSDRDRLFWTAHHLVIDGVSWRILIEDLACVYAAIVAGKPAPTLRTGTGAGTWAESVRRSVELGAFNVEVDVWNRITAGALPRLPSDTGARDGTVADLRTVSIALPPELGKRLLGDAHVAYRTRGVELFVAALRLAYADWNPGAELYLQLEGHGREAELAPLDVSRTVGWFTSVYPIRFGLAEEGAGNVVRETKETLRRIPRNGAGFGWLQAHGGEVARDWRVLPEVGFNFLGDFDIDAQATPFRLSSGLPTGARDPRLPITQPLVVFGYAIAGELHWSCEYDSKRLAESTVRELMNRFASAQRTIAQATAEQMERSPEGIPSPVDFTCRKLNLAGFDRLLEKRQWAPESIEDIQPLSPMQQGLYFETLNSPQSEAYFEQASFRLSGSVNVSAFVDAWRDLVSRHATLRSVFVQGEGGEDALQVVFRHGDVPVSVTDLSDHTDREQRATIAAFQRADRRSPFDLATGPLMRVQLFELGRGDLHVVWSHHHILMDGWCVGILYEDLMALYQARVVGRAPALETPPDYRAYLTWLESLDRASSAQFWRRELEGFDSLTVVPRTRAATAAEYRCAKEKLILDGSGWTTLLRIAAESGATPALVLQTLWGILLARYNRTGDVLFGGIVSGRPEQVPHVEKMVGLFINALPIRLRFEPGLTFGAALRRFQEQAIERRPHEYVPLSDIKAQAPALRDIFDHLLVLENYPMDEELRGSELSPEGSTRPRLSEIDGFERTHFDLTLVAVPRADGLEIELTYNDLAYPPSQIRRVKAHLRALVDAVAARPDVPCLDLEWLPTDERQQIETWNATTARYPEDATIVSLFDEQVVRHAGRRAVTSGGISKSYREIDTAVRGVAARLRQAGISRGERVAIWLPRGTDLVVALLATLRAGGCYVPLDPEYPEERLRFILEDSGANVVIAHSGHRSPFATCKEVLVDEASVESAAARAAVATSVARPDDPAYIIYTSGSTGKPKGCLISHRNVVRLMRNERFDFEFGPEDVWVVAHSFCFDFSVWEMYGALLNGGRVVVAPRDEVRDVRAFADLVRRERITVLNQTPAAFYAFLDEALKVPDHDFGAHLRYVVFGGDRLDPRYLSPWATRYGVDRPALINMYGITETTVHVTFHRITQDEIRAADGRSIIGRPLPETQVWVLDEHFRVQPIGIPGEIYVGGSGVGIGYLNRAELTAERFLPNPFSSDAASARLYRSGDLGVWREDGCLEYLGRNDHQVQVRGFRVELGEVEAACLRQPGVAKAVVLPFERAAGQLELVAYLVGEPRLASEMRGALEPLLPHYMIPAHFEWVAGIPLTSNGKIDRKALPVPGQSEAATTLGNDVAPRNAMERALAAIWSEILEKPSIGVRDNFFDLGGQSLKAVRMRARIEEVLNASVSLRDLFSYPTIEELARIISPQGSPAVADDELASLVDGLTPEEIEAQLRTLEK